MTPCPLCLLGFPEPHSDEEWNRVATDQKMQDELERILEARQVALEESARRAGRDPKDLPPGLCG